MTFVQMYLFRKHVDLDRKLKDYIDLKLKRSCCLRIECCSQSFHYSADFNFHVYGQCCIILRLVLEMSRDRCFGVFVSISFFETYCVDWRSFLDFRQLSIKWKSCLLYWTSGLNESHTNCCYQFLHYKIPLFQYEQIIRTDDALLVDLVFIKRIIC